MKKTAKKEENRWIDIHNDEIMHKMGLIRAFICTPRDKSVWEKTKNEKRILKNTKYSVRNEDGHFHNIPCKHIPVKSKLIIQLKKNKKFSKNTYSIECWQSDIPNILKNYKPLIIKYSFNGITYAPNEIPFWNL